MKTFSDIMNKHLLALEEELGVRQEEDSDKGCENCFWDLDCIVAQYNRSCKYFWDSTSKGETDENL